MVEFIPPPDPRALLPPLLACLPTAFVSQQPPPALLSLLSPILRQRVQILSSVAASSTESWLRLLCWDSGKGERLQSLIDGATFEPHPVSGEIDLPDDIPVAYKRVDEETLHSQVIINDYQIKVVYLWCPKAENSPSWLVAQVLPHEGAEEGDGVWAPSIGDANINAKEKMVDDALKAAENYQYLAPPQQEEDEDDDDDYWARYDATPGRTPSVKNAVPPALTSALQSQGPSEAAYFDQYADVQPAMDNHDPDEEHPELGPTSLGGDMLAELAKRDMSNGNAAPYDYTNGTNGMPLNHPRPESASSSNSEAVSKLEQEAENQSNYEVGVKQHIGSNIKSLFRLAKATGMSRADFQSLVKTELDLLNLSDDD
ncbi:uncharacterized protein BDV14DRAFT_165494 [Aspergillus stella-maris]|uniref:uncharacterized protein n=1 Tax=Aspergillus stella-maris TaxID=1810926 RepID=UPI003CCD26B8